MAIQISGTNVIDNSYNLANIASFDSTVTSIWDSVTTTAVNKTVVNREFCTVTASGRTITLPASPSSGWEVVIGVENFVNTVIGRNSQNIMGLAEDLTIDIANVALTFTYVNATRGWIVS